MSIAEAIKSGKLSVVVFATPKFCSSQTCGPTLGIVKRVADDFEGINFVHDDFEGINFVHVEPYELPADPANLQPIEAVQQWGLPSEPWVFVMDASGRVVAKYEGVVGKKELTGELRAL
jgi:hypothetical protein